jgi:tape measure domain-containing protein
MAIEAAKLVVNITTDISKMTKGMKDADDKLANFSKKASIAGVALTGAVTVPAIAAAKGMLNVAMGMEQSEIAFTTMLGSGEKASRFLKDLQDFAASTPFEFTELQDASRRMIAFGFSARDVLPMMTDIGDAVSGLGLGSAGVDRVVLALGQMQAKAKVSGQEMMQLTEAGIPAWGYLAEAMNLSTAEVMKLSEQGLIPADMAIQAILAGMREDFGGMMAEQAKTAAGQLSNLRDEVVFLAADLGEELLPIFKDAVDAAKNMVAAFSELPDETKKNILIFGGVAAAIGPATTAIGGMSAAARGLIGVYPKLAKGYTALAATGLGKSLGLAAIGFGSVATAAGIAAIAIGSVAIAWEKFINKTNEKGAEDVKTAWSGFFEEQIKKGASATEILEEYRKAQARVQEQMGAPKWTNENGAWELTADELAKSFIQNKDQLISDTKGLNAAIADSTKTYQEYIDVIRYGGADVQQMSYDQWAAINGFDTFSMSVENAAIASEQAFQDMVAAAGETKGELSGLLGEYQNLSAEMDNWVKGAANNVLTALEQKFPNATETFKQYVGILDETMGTDFLQQIELQETIDNLVSSLDGSPESFEKFSSGLLTMKEEGLADAKAELEEVATKAQELYDKLLALPEEIRIAINFDVEPLPPFLNPPPTFSLPPGGYNKPTENREALGGPVYPGKAYWVGERGPEPFIPFTAGQIVPNNKAGGRVVIEAGAIQITAPTKNTDIPFLVDTLMDEIQRRLI